MRRIRLFLGSVGFVALLGVVALHLANDTSARPVLAILSLGQFFGPQSVVINTAQSRLFAVTSIQRQPPRGSPLHSGVMIVDTRTGRVLRTITTGITPSNLVLDPKNGRIVASAQIGETIGDIQLLDKWLGTSLGRVTFGTVPTAIAVDGRREHAFIVGGGENGFDGIHSYTVPNRVVTVDLRTMRVVHTVPISPSPSNIAVEEASGRVIITAADGLHVLDAATGTPLRTMMGLQSVLGVDHYTHRFVVVDSAGNVRLLNAMTGRVNGVVSVGGMRLSPSNVAVDERNGRVILVTPGAINGLRLAATPGQLRVLDGVTGRVLQSNAVGAYTRAVAVWPGYAFLAAYNRTTSIDVFDLQKGRVVRTMDVGLYPTEVEADEHTKRVFVLGSLPLKASAPDPWEWVPPQVRHALPFLPPPSRPFSSQPEEQSSTAGLSIIDPEH